jgi:exonuclease VII large subunit
MFDSAEKKPLLICRRIGVVTSQRSGDPGYLHTIRNGWLGVIYLSSASVQGEDAPAELIKAYKNLVEMEAGCYFDCRAGGSLEDLGH